MKMTKKKLAVAVTVALLALPLSTALTLADTVIPITATTATTATATTAALQAAESAVAAYEGGPIATLAQVATAECLNAASVTAIAAVGNGDAKTALELRVTKRAGAITTAKTTLQAEAAVAAYQGGPITTLAQIATAEGLKAAAVTAIAAVGDVNTKTALQLKVTNRAATIATAKTTLATQVVDANGNIVTSSTWFKEFIVKLQLALTFDPARKGELNERQALAKLAEAQELMKEGKPEAAQICLNEYTDKIAKAQAFLDQVKDPNSETAKTLAIALANINSKNLQVLGNLIDKLPPQAAEKLALNVVRTMEKAVQKIQKEEAKVALEKNPVTTSPATTPVVDNKSLENQAKVALENFKKSINQKGKIHLEDQDLQDQNQQENGDKKVVEQPKPEQEKPDMEHSTQQVIQSQSPQTQSITQSQSTHATATVAPIRPQTTPTFSSSEQGKQDRNKRSEKGKNKGGDNQDNQRND